jgi:hypothetical protein
MKCFYVLSVVTIVAGMLALDVAAGPKKKPAPLNPGKVIAVGGNGGNANGTGATGGNGGGAVAVGGNTSGGNVIAVGGNGGNAKGKGSKGGNGGGAVAVGGNNNGTIINGNNNNVTNITNKNITFSPVFGGGGFGGGFGGGVGGGVFVAGNGAPGVAIASTPDQTVIATDGGTAIATSGPSGDIAEREDVFTRRFLKVKNDADVAMKVFVQYRGFADKKWAWLPADPSASQNALVYNLQPGQEALVEHDSQKVAASRVRVWAVAQGQNWLDYRDQDLWIVPEVDQRGEHRYLATEMKTFTFIFPKLQK